MPKRTAVMVDRYVGERVRDRRAELGKTQQDLARELGISYQQVQKYETGANRISAGRLFEIAQLLRVAPADLFEGVDGNTVVEPLEHGGKNRAVIEMVRNYDAIPESELRTAIASLVKSITLRRKPRGRG